MRNRIRMWGTSIYLYCKGALTFSLPLGAKMKDECVSVLTPIFLQQQNCWLSAGSNPPSLDWEPLSRLVPIWSAPVPLGQPFAGLTKCHIWIHCRHQVTWRHEPSSNGTVWHQSSSDWRKGSRHAKSPAINLYPHWYFFFYTCRIFWVLASCCLFSCDKTCHFFFEHLSLQTLCIYTKESGSFLPSESLIHVITV